MPYASVEELPRSQVARYGERARRAFLHAVNSALYRGLPEDRAFRIAHTAAKRADRKAKAKAIRLKRRRRS